MDIKVRCFECLTWGTELRANADRWVLNKDGLLAMKIDMISTDRCKQQYFLSTKTLIVAYHTTPYPFSQQTASKSKTRSKISSRLLLIPHYEKEQYLGRQVLAQEKSRRMKTRFRKFCRSEWYFNLLPITSVWSVSYYFERSLCLNVLSSVENTLSTCLVKKREKNAAADNTRIFPIVRGDKMRGKYLQYLLKLIH